MKTVGQNSKRSGSGVKPGFNQHEENGLGVRDGHREELSRQVEDHLLLAEGLHLRLPDRDRRLRQARRQFEERDAVLLGGSTDNEFSKLGWRRDHKDLTSSATGVRRLEGLAGRPARRARHAEGVALRATFIVDPDTRIQHVSVNNLNVGRNPEEVLRILDGLQTDELCPCNRRRQATLNRRRTTL